MNSSEWLTANKRLPICTMTSIISRNCLLSKRFKKEGFRIDCMKGPIFIWHGGWYKLVAMLPLYVFELKYPHPVGC